MSMPRLLIPALLLLALPLPAATREHAVRPFPMVTVSGVVRGPNGVTVAGAVVTSGNSFSNTNGTSTDGKYSLTVPGYRPTQFTIRDFAYDTQSVVFTPVPGTTLDVTLTALHPTVTVKMSSGEMHVLDIGTSQFAYLVTLSGYIPTDTVNLCKADGSSFVPSKSDFSRIVGPGASVNFAPCCSIGPTLMVNVEMKSGEKTAAYFNDACLGNEVDFIGREPSTGNWQYLRFTDIAEIDFP